MGEGEQAIDREIITPEYKIIENITGVGKVMFCKTHEITQDDEVLTDSRSLVRRLASGPARQSDSTCSTIWTL